MPGRRVEAPARAEAVGYASAPKRHLSATPSTLIGDVGGVGDRPRDLSVASATGRGTCRWRRRQAGADLHDAVAVDDHLPGVRVDAARVEHRTAGEHGTLHRQLHATLTFALRE
jgi:hypothetical protein